MKYFFLSAFAFLSMQTNSYAYLDPATGSLILQYLLAGIAAVASTASFFWQKIRDFFVHKILRKKVKENQSKKTEINNK
jgi:hypothetical protein